ALAVTPQPQAIRAHPGLACNHGYRRPRIPCQDRQRRIRPAARGPFPTAVVDERRDTERRPEPCQVLVEWRIAGTTPGRMDRDNTRARGCPRRHHQGPSQASSVTARELDLTRNELTQPALLHLPDN